MLPRSSARSVFKAQMPLPQRFKTSRIRTASTSARTQDEAGRILDGGGVGTKGRAAGGKALGSTAPGAPGKPKVFNFSTPGAPGDDKGLTKEQKKEVEEHNREFERTHDNEEGSAAKNKVHKKFWTAGHQDGKKTGK